jgi:hypothetical protein
MSDENKRSAWMGNAPGGSYTAKVQALAEKMGLASTTSTSRMMTGARCSSPGCRATAIPTSGCAHKRRSRRRLRALPLLSADPRRGAYRSITRLRRKEVLRPVRLPGIELTVGELFRASR